MEVLSYTRLNLAISNLIHVPFLSAQLCQQGTVSNVHLTTPSDVLGGTEPIRVYGKATDCLSIDLNP